MNTSINKTDALNAVLTIDIVVADYKETVDKKLKEYKKQLTMPGFRKGFVPMGLLKKKYGQSILLEEVNKLLQTELSRYIKDEKLNILGNPIPKKNADFSLEKEDFSFVFDIGLAPYIKIDLKKIKSITDYKVEATDDLIDDEVENIKKRYGTVTPYEKIVEGVKIKGIFENEEEHISNETTFELQDLKKEVQKEFLGKEKEAILSLRAKDLFEEDFRLSTAVGKKIDEAKNLNAILNFTVKEISTTIPATIDEVLLKKIFGKKTDVKDEVGLRAKIKEDSEKQFAQQADQILMKNTIDALIDKTKFDLPVTFLQKWIQSKEKEPMSDEAAKEAFEKAERDIRRQLIETHLIESKAIKVDEEALKNYAKSYITKQIAQHRRDTPEEKELEEITERILSNEQEAQRLQSNFINEKLLETYRAEVPYKEKKIKYKDFVEKIKKVYK